MFCVGYEYEKFKLTRAELIYYYERLSVRGLCLSLLAEFEQELSSDGVYSLVRLVRPSAEDPDSALLLKEYTEQHLRQFSSFVSSQVTKPSDAIPEGEQFVTHDGNRSFQNKNISRSRAAVDSFTKSTSVEVEIPEGEVTVEELLVIPNLTIARMKQLGTAEGITWSKYKKGTMKKADYIEAFVAHRADKNGNSNMLNCTLIFSFLCLMICFLCVQ